MKDKIRINWFKISILVIFLFIIGSTLYWFEWRPAQIRHNCSWIKRHSDAKSEITQEQYNKCEEEYSGSMFMAKYSCEEPQPFVPARNWLEKANKDEYNFCIHEKGL